MRDPEPAGLRPTISAHRGYSGRAPENTRSAFALAIQAGADGMECDVHLTADGHLAISHDSDVTRMSDGTGLVAYMTLAELRALRWGDERQYPVAPGTGWSSRELMTLPELIDLLKAAPRRLELFIETKHPSPAGRGLDRAVAAVLADAGWGGPGPDGVPSPARIVSFDPDSLVELAACGLEVPRILLIEARPGPSAGEAARAADRALAARAREAVASGAVTGFGPWIPLLVSGRDRLAEFGFKQDPDMLVLAWNVMSREDVRVCLDAGVTTVGTDHVEMTAAFLRDMGNGDG
ncbi:MAG: hypothetical protein LBK95_10270 [Bifidobacteriaceae bacterium]|jgi:glycerophosphoryl diester phosphodiesterase|nr:hypothetical protein [Bifidobacteriaceae bacterium]